MALSDMCAQCSPAWRNQYADAFMVKDDSGQNKTVFRFAVPYNEENDAILQKRFHLAAETRRQYYQSLVQGIQRSIKITNALKIENVPSILCYEVVEQENNSKSGQNFIYIQTQAVRPIMQVLFDGDIGILTLLDIFIRLSIIVRDIGKEPWSVSHRGISMDEIYVNQENKILLGGFYYSCSAELMQPMPYLPDAPKHFPQDLVQGGAGDRGTDIQTLCLLLYNILSGLPWDTEWANIPRVAPAFAADGLERILIDGMTCTDADCNYFRRRLLNYRKDISRTALASTTVPVVRSDRKEYRYEMTPSQP